MSHAQLWISSRLKQRGKQSTQKYFVTERRQLTFKRFLTREKKKYRLVLPNGNTAARFIEFLSVRVIHFTRI